MIGNEAGLTVKPELTFEKIKRNIGGEFEPTTGKIKFNENVLSSKNFGKNPMTQDEILRHELKHFEQFSEIARANGPEVVARAKEYTQAMINKSKINKALAEEIYAKYNVAPVD